MATAAAIREWFIIPIDGLAFAQHMIVLAVSGHISRVAVGTMRENAKVQ